MQVKLQLQHAEEDFKRVHQNEKNTHRMETIVVLIHKTLIDMIIKTRYIPVSLLSSMSAEFFI